MPKETAFLLDLAERHPFIKGVVGWLDLCAPDIEKEIEGFASNPRLKGMRMLIHDRIDPDFADSKAHARGVGLLEPFRLTYDLLLRPQHLGSAIRLVDRLPNQRFVIDHIAKPVIGDAPDARWSDGIRQAAKRPNVWCKLSGLPTLVPPGEFKLERLKPYLDFVLDAFGPSRVMIGSDWPVSSLRSDYGGTMALVETWSARLSGGERAAVLGRTCAEFYRLPPS